MLNDLLAKNGSGGDKLYVEDVFSTWLYTGNGSTQTITNGIDLAGKGGLVWTKFRSGSFGTEQHALIDTARGANYYLSSDSTAAQVTSYSNVLTAFNSNGYTLGADTSSGKVNYSAQNYASWTFRKAPKFFDVVTYTGNGSTANRAITHGLGSVPGMIIVKRSTGGTSSWIVYHRSLSSGNNLNLNSVSVSSGNGYWSVAPTAADFTLSGMFGAGEPLNQSGSTYVAYLFAHDTTADGVIQCGSFTTDSSGNATVSLGWEPQFGIFKNSGGAANWMMFDTMRGAPVDGNGLYLQPNTTSAEAAIGAGVGYLCPTSTGFQVKGLGGVATIIYLAIRRGPMRTPTSGTSVFTPIAQGTGTNGLPSFPSDAVITQQRSGGIDWQVGDRLRGFLAKYSAWVTGTTTASAWLATNNTNAESTTGAKFGTPPDSVLPFVDNNNMPALVPNGQTNAIYFFKRAPGFFDVACYTGTGTTQTISHNLGVAPELMIAKSRSGARNWMVFTPTLFSFLNLTNAAGSNSTVSFSTSSFTVSGSLININTAGETEVAYLFASCPGVSKVGSYTGTGTTLQINCGFTNGARFVLIKRTDSTGDWYVYDSARGIVAGNDPYLLLNSTAAEVTNTDYVDAYSAGFELSSTAPAALNASGGTYIYLAIA